MSFIGPICIIKEAEQMAFLVMRTIDTVVDDFHQNWPCFH